MEEAYSELYQQFLRLRSLCLRQAALLHQLTTALQKQQGSAVPNGELSGAMSIPVQCTQPSAAAAEGPVAQCCVDHLTRNTGTFSNLLAEDLAKLSVASPSQRRTDGMLQPNAAPPLSLESLKWPGDCKTSTQADCSHRKRTTPLTGWPSLEDDFLDQSGALLMSDVALQSQTCEFCQAVFPGDTTTRGEFLRHLHTHIT